MREHLLRRADPRSHRRSRLMTPQAEQLCRRKLKEIVNSCACWIEKSKPFSRDYSWFYTVFDQTLDLTYAAREVLDVALKKVST